VYRKAPPKPTKTNPNPLGEVGLSERSYLYWLSEKAFGVDKEILYENAKNEKIEFIDKSKLAKIEGKLTSVDDLESVSYEEQEVIFKKEQKETASKTQEQKFINEKLNSQATLGTAIHSILQRYWQRLEDENILQKIYLKYTIYDKEKQEKIQHYIANFLKTNTYKMLKSGVEHHFEMEFNSFANGKHTQGIIDLLYFDEVENGWVIVDFKSNNIQNVKNLAEFAKEKEYDKQLQAYKQLCQDKGMEVVKTILLFLDRGDEIGIR
jgi:hypothetical protein